mmetsp:Transcript_41907/g.82762  ORF Transcript_41907/g.82762 Transcript_41907/m.82762 type:complete len:116 (+) Transcript_41907:410-757(+)
MQHRFFPQFLPVSTLREKHTIIGWTEEGGWGEGEREREREGKADSLIDNGKRGRIKEDRCRQTERERENSAASEVATAPAAHATRKVSRSQEIRTCAKISAEHTQEEKGGARREG